MLQKLQGMAHGQVLRSRINPAGTSERPDVKNPNSTVDVQPGANPTGQLQPVASNSGLPIELPSGGLSPLPEHVSSSSPLSFNLEYYQTPNNVEEPVSSPQDVSNSTVVETVDGFLRGTSVGFFGFCGLLLLPGRKVDDKMIGIMLKTFMFFSLVDAVKGLYSPKFDTTNIEFNCKFFGLSEDDFKAKGNKVFMRKSPMHRHCGYLKSDFFRQLPRHRHRTYIKCDSRNPSSHLAVVSQSESSIILKFPGQVEGFTIARHAIVFKVMNGNSQLKNVTIVTGSATDKNGVVKGALRLTDSSNQDSSSQFIFYDKVEEPPQRPTYDFPLRPGSD